MAIGDLFTIEKQNSKVYSICSHSKSIIRYMLVRNHSTGELERKYQKQCVFCKGRVGQRIAFYRVLDRKNISIWDNGEFFKGRDEKIHLWALKNIPFKPKKKGYKRYLSTKKWTEKRKAVLRRDKYICQNCCASKAHHVHHLTYDNLYNEPLEDLISICLQCHRRLHGKYGDNSAISSVSE